LRALPVCQRFTRHRAEFGGYTCGHPEIGRQKDFAGVLQAASIVAEGHLARGQHPQGAFPGNETHGIDQFTDEPAAEMRIAKNRTTDRPRRSRPGLEPRGTVDDRPANQSVDRDFG
jgi:hypothetical protein